MAVESDVLIVGSGPAGAMAAWALRGSKGSVRILDAGHEQDVFPPAGAMHALRQQQDLTAYRIGERAEGLRHLRDGHPPVSLKLRAPALDFVTRNSARLTPVHSSSFHAVVSLAKGGFGNAWGAGVYRFQDDELRGMPLSTSDLAPHYDEVSRHIGVSGSADDDLGTEFGWEPELLPPLAMGRNAAALLTAYESGKQEPALQSVRMGQSRLAVLSREYRGRPGYAFRGMEHLEPGGGAIYNPTSTIDALRASGAVEYEAGWIVRSFRESESGVLVTATRRDGGATQEFHARHLLLAAGALNSARIVLASASDCASQLPLLDNPMTVLPVLHPQFVGVPAAGPESGFAQLNLVLDAERFGCKYQGSVYSTASAQMSEFLAQLPFSLGANRRLLRALLPAISLVMVFYPASPSPSQYVQLREDGSLEAAYPWQPDPRLAGELARVFRGLGCWAHAGIARHAGPGQGIHYAGTLPHAARPSRYQLHPDGRLEGTRGVYVCDGSCFPHLPARNLTFTIMANAHRIATALAERRLAR
jgi:choline dehydrogenase-like flavoprotein